MEHTMGPAADRDRTGLLAEEMVGLAYADLTAEDVEQVKRLMLDHVGVAHRGATLAWGLALTEWAETLGSHGPCVIFGNSLRSAPSVAALVNATAAHGMELDDTHDESITHPGAVVIATALAVGTAVEAAGDDVIAAIVAGYEVMARAGMATGAAEIIEHGFHPTALFGGFGAATAAAKLYGLDAGQLTQAWGLMLSMTGGSMQFSQDAHGTTVKRLHGGYGAHHGTIAAEFARLGIAGPAQAFDGTYGLCNLFGQTPAPERLERAADAPWQIHRISLKPYPCCRLFHSTIDALREATEDFSIPDDAIAEIRVGGPEIMVSQHMLRRPESVMAAQYSLPYALGATLVYGPSRYAAYAEDKLADARILALGDRVEAVEDERMQAAFPAQFGSWVELVARDGGRRRVDVMDSHGTPARPMAATAIADKIAGVLADLDNPPDVDTITEAVWSVEDQDGLNRLVAIFHQ
jgi:2-methylcitrate dehydratase PrpD